MLVLICHTIPIISQNSHVAAFTNYMGLFGVEIFFVLSGFLIGLILIKTHQQEQTTSINTVKIFWLRRWFRTLPNYYLVIIAMEIIYYPSSRFFVFSLQHNFSYLFFVQNLFTEMPDRIFAVSWSLAIEEWFYFLFPIALLIVQYLIPNKQKAMLTVIVVFIAVPFLSRTVVSLSNASISFDQGYRKMVPFRLDAIGIGVLAAYFNYYYKNAYQRLAERSLIVGLTLFAVTLLFVYLTGVISFPYTAFIKQTLFFSMISISFALILPFFSELKSLGNKVIEYPINFISLISYSAYLIHQLIILLVWIALTKLGYVKLSYLNFGLVWFFTIVVSYAQYRLFERPITDLRDRFGKGKKVTV